MPHEHATSAGEERNPGSSGGGNRGCRGPAEMPHVDEDDETAPAEHGATASRRGMPPGAAAVTLLPSTDIMRRPRNLGTSGAVIFVGAAASESKRRRRPHPLIINIIDHKSIHSLTKSYNQNYSLNKLCK